MILIQFTGELKLAALFKIFPSIYSSDHRSILRMAFSRDSETQFELVLILVRLSQQMPQATRAKLLAELTKYEEQIEGNQKLFELLAKVDM